LALEALQPQSFSAQEKLINDPPPRRRRGESAKPPAHLLLPFDLQSGLMPWHDTAGDRALLKRAAHETGEPCD
jgi:hypothetical protein